MKFDNGVKLKDYNSNDEGDTFFIVASTDSERKLVKIERSLKNEFDILREGNKFRLQLKDVNEFEKMYNICRKLKDTFEISSWRRNILNFSVAVFKCKINGSMIQVKNKTYEDLETYYNEFGITNVEKYNN